MRSFRFLTPAEKKAVLTFLQSLSEFCGGRQARTSSLAGTALPLGRGMDKVDSRES
jgi:hypothetical protein